MTRGSASQTDWVLMLIMFLPLFLLFIAFALLFAVYRSPALVLGGNVLSCISGAMLLYLLFIIPYAELSVSFWKSHLPLVILVLLYVYLGIMAVFYNVWLESSTWLLLTLALLIYSIAGLFFMYGYRGGIPILIISIIGTALFIIIGTFWGCELIFGPIPWTPFWKVIGYGLCL